MIISKVAAGETAAFSLRSGVLKIEGQVEIPLAERQEENERVIDVCLDNDLLRVREGLGAWYVATVVVPAREYEYVEGETDEEPGELVAIPLDTKKVKLVLWPLPQVYLDSKSIPQQQPDMEVAE